MVHSQIQTVCFYETHWSNKQNFKIFLNIECQSQFSSWSFTNPLETFQCMTGNILNCNKTKPKNNMIFTHTLTDKRIRRKKWGITKRGIKMIVMTRKSQKAVFSYCGYMVFILKVFFLYLNLFCGQYSHSSYILDVFLLVYYWFCVLFFVVLFVWVTTAYVAPVLCEIFVKFQIISYGTPKAICRWRKRNEMGEKKYFSMLMSALVKLSFNQ